MADVGREVLDDLGWQVVVEHLARRCHTLRGQQVAEELMPDLERSVAVERIEAVAELRALAEDDVTMPFGGITDIESSAARAAKGGALHDEELVRVAAASRGLTRLWRVLRNHEDKTPRLASLASELSDLSGVFEPIDKAYGPDGRLADSASETLGRLRREVERLDRRLRGRMDAMLGELRAHLQDDYFTQRDDRFVVPVRVGARGKVPGIIHGTSQSGQTVFVEPSEIVDGGNKLKLAECAVADEEERIRAELSRHVEAGAEQLIAAADAATFLDLLCACASLADATESVAPVVSGEGLELMAARHPHLVLAAKPCVANDIHLSRRSILIVSGPNAGGKTVALKTAGLAVLMARAGLHVLAARGSRLAWFDSVLTDIGDAQSLEQDLSTFSGHLVNLNRFAREAGPGTLLLIDEICVGTEPEQGAALAQAVLEAFATTGMCGIVTTHYERLKVLAAEHESFSNASVGYDVSRMRPTYELHLDVAGSSGALIVARELGLSGAVIDRAESLLGSEKARVEELLIEVSAERERLSHRHEELEAAMAEAERERARAELAREEAKEAKKRAHERAHDGAVAALREARLELEKAKEGVKRRSSSLRDLDRSVDAAAKAVRENAPVREREIGRAADEAALVPGVAVLISTLGSRGKVLSEPARGQAHVQIGSMKMMVEVSDLRIIDDGSASKSKAKVRSSVQRAPAAQDGARRTPDATLDLRGARVDEALDAVERFIDESLLDERSAIYIIHGHGTGALRKAVRGHLKAHKVVSSHRPGEPSEGGDGVTVAVLEA